MNKKEQSFTTKFNTWAKHHLQPPAMIEIKHTHGKDYLSFKAVKSHQRAWLKAGIGPDSKPYKISDQGAGHKPCDTVLFGLMDSWVAIKYPNCFVVIDIEKFLDEEKRGKRKSLTKKRAKAIAEYVV
jgi:hypothetical protein